MERRMTGNYHVRCGAGENSEMISKNYLSLFGSMRDTKPEIGITELCHIKCRLRHIIAEILAVSTRISDELALIERLRIVECLLRRITERLVRFTL